MQANKIGFVRFSSEDCYIDKIAHDYCKKKFSDMDTKKYVDL